MNALILAAGYATRMGALALDRPKALLPVANRPILDYLIQALRGVESIDRISLVTNRKFAAARAYPIHLGVTESGPVEAGSIRSAVGMGVLLSEGIGDTIRVSLATSDPREEVRVAHEILKTLAFRKESPTLVACPTCGRLEYDMVPTVKAVESYIARLKVPITVAVMGCVVSGPAEARHADIGVTGGRGKGVIFKKGTLYKTVPQEELLPVLLAEIDAIAAEHAPAAPAPLPS